MNMASWVATMKEEFVAPSEPTPCATLPLSSIDHALGMSFMLEMICVYPNNNREHRRLHGVSSLPAAKVIREALSKALVPYYPVAGRVVSSGPDDLVEVVCNGEGVWFVEAAVTDRGLVDVHDWESSIPVKEELVPNCPAHLNQEEMILMMQVTHFQCGGFVVGLKFNHLVFDGIGIGQFLKAVGEIARGQTHPSINPVWYRETIPALPKFPKGTSVFTTKLDAVNSLYDFSIQTINRFKENIAKETSNPFTTFEIVAAILWKCRTQAISAVGDVYLSFTVNIRHLLCQLPKAGYYGNGLFPLTIQADSEQVMKASLTELVRLIRDAKQGLSTKFKQWASGNFKEDPYKILFDYNTLTLSDWRRIEFYETDYGWGVPHSICPVHNFTFTGGVLLKEPLPKEGVRFEGQVVKKEHEQRFIDEIQRCINM